MDLMEFDEDQWVFEATRILVFSHQYRTAARSGLTGLSLRKCQKLSKILLICHSNRKKDPHVVMFELQALFVF